MYIRVHWQLPLWKVIRHCYRAKKRHCYRAKKLVNVGTSPTVCKAFLYWNFGVLISKWFMSRYMGTITGIGDLDPDRWPNSHWRSVKVNDTSLLLKFVLLLLLIFILHFIFNFYTVSCSWKQILREFFLFISSLLDFKSLSC